MPLAILHSRTLVGLTSLPVRVEADLANGLPQFSLVGLPSTAVRESRERVRAAIQNSGFAFPARRVTVNLAPADLPKDSGHFDLAIALAILLADGQLPAPASSRLEKVVLAGELSLSGALLPIRAGFAWGLSALKNSSVHTLLLPSGNAPELSLLMGGPRIRCAHSLRSVCEDLLPTHSQLPTADALGQSSLPRSPALLDAPLCWEDIHGQQQAKRAALVAAAGRHNLLLFGPPGVGKSMLAQRLGTLLPELTDSQAQESAALQSLDGSPLVQLWRRPPVRAPHHSTSSRALIGGGQPVRPGEISLAHNGLLFLDELPEFPRDALEALREPIETGEVRIARVHDRITLPARFMLVAAMNPCPCGFYGVSRVGMRCACRPEQVHRYRSRLSGPLLDRFDLVVSMGDPHMGDSHALGKKDLSPANPWTTEHMAAQVRAARHRAAELEQPMRSDDDARTLLDQVVQAQGLSPRASSRITRVATTIAHLEGARLVSVAHMAEAISLRRALDVPPALMAPRSSKPRTQTG